MKFADYVQQFNIVFVEMKCSFFHAYYSSIFNFSLSTCKISCHVLRHSSYGRYCNRVEGTFLQRNAFSHSKLDMLRPSNRFNDRFLFFKLRVPHMCRSTSRSIPRQGTDYAKDYTCLPSICMELIPTLLNSFQQTVSVRYIPC